MADYRPETIAERVLASLAHVPGGLGRRAQKELRRRFMKRNAQVFDSLEASLNDGAICLDLGANYGRFTQRLAATGAAVHAYEPDPDTFAVMKDRIGDLPNVTLHQCAVAAESGLLKLHRLPEGVASTEEKRSQGASLLPSDRAAGGETVDVEVRAFKDILAGFGRPIDLVKMDIEGSELDILEDLFTNPGDYPIKTLLVETHERQRPDHLPRVVRYRKLAGALAVPDVHLYWP